MPWSAAGKPTRGAWQFRNVTQDFDFWPTLESVGISQLHPDGLATLTCSVEDRDSTIEFANGDEARVLFDGARIWAGHIRIPGKGLMSEHGPRVWELTGQDYTAKLDDSVVLTEAGERPRESIEDRVTWILSFLDYAITTASVNLPSEDVEPYDYDGSTVREALQQVSDEKALHFYVDFEKDLHMFRTETIAAPFDISTSPDYSTTFPCSEFHIDDGDDIELTNAVRVKGLRYKRWVTDTDSIAAFGRQESAIIDDSLITLAQVNAAGQRRLFQLAWPIVDGTFVCYEPGLHAGMTLHITDSRWGVDDDYILTDVEITAPDPHDESGEAMLFQRVSFTDRRRVGRFPGGGKDIKDSNHPGDGGGGSSDGGTENPPGSCCNPVPTGEEPFISWGETNLMGVEQGHTSGSSHSFLLPDGSGYAGGVVGGDIINRQVFLFLMAVDERPGIGLGNLDLLPAPWTLQTGGTIPCTHGFAPFNNGHPNMQTQVWSFDVDDNPGDYTAAGAVEIVASAVSMEVLWVAVLVGGTGPGAIALGPGSTDWDIPDWSSGLPDTDTGNRALILSVAFNRAWDSTGSGLGLNPEDHDTSIVTGIPDGFARLAAAVGGEKTMFVDYAFSGIDEGAGIPTVALTGYSGTGGSQDFIITRQLGIEVNTSGSGTITPGPTWEGGNPLLPDGAGDVPSYAITDGVVTITSDVAEQVWAWTAAGPPDLPTSIGDWIISQQFNLSEAGSLTDDGERYLRIAAGFDGKHLAALVRFGDAVRAQGVEILAAPDVFAAKDIVEGEDHVFQVRWDGTTLYARFWLLADGEPAADDWDVSSSSTPYEGAPDDFYYSVGIGNDGGTPMVLVLPSPTIEGGALAGESVEWEIVGYGDGTETTFETRYPYDELSLHVRVDAQMLNGTAIDDMDGAAGEFTLTSAPYGDPSDPDGSSVVEARYTRT